jgi:hypothetical protein
MAGADRPRPAPLSATRPALDRAGGRPSQGLRPSPWRT